MSINQNSQLDFNRTNHIGMMVTSGGVQQPSQQQQQQSTQQQQKPDLFNFSNNPIPAVIDDNNVKHQQTSMASNKNAQIHDSGKNCQQKLTYPLILCDDHQLYDKENSFYLYHHDPATYLPNYENLSTTKYPDKFSTMECHGGNGVQTFPLQHFNIPISKMHASTCNLNNQFNSSNLINGHHFSNSLNNFHVMDPHAQIPNYYNFNPSFTQLPDTIHRSGNVIGGMPGAFGSSSIMGSSFASNISLNGTPKQQQANMSWKHRNCSSRSSSSGTNSSSK
jgi:hypothetical protein